MENRAYTQYKHQCWSEPCTEDGKTELSLLSCSGKLYIQLYPSSPSTAHMLQQKLDNTTGLTSAHVPACGYSTAGKPFGACLYSGYSTTAWSLFGVAFPYCVFTQGSSRLSNNSSLNPTTIPCTPSMLIISFGSVSRRRPSGLVRTSASC